jgi:hypothetical protein|eukprot:COSAG02_NODE_5355_length_4403_cov_7.574856_2_plen_33_part_00
MRVAALVPILEHVQSVLTCTMREHPLWGTPRL